MVPLEPEHRVDLSTTSVLLSAGRRDPICSPEQAERLAALLTERDAAVELTWHDGGHALPREHAVRQTSGASLTRGDAVPRCRPETVAFATRAPLRATVVRELSADPTRVFGVLADAESWPRWFPGLRAARWTSPDPYDVGATRQVTLGPLKVDEEFIVWEPGERFAFTFTETNLPGTRAGVELVELVGLPSDRTRLSYTFAVEPVGLPSALGASLAPAVRTLIGRGLAGMERELAAGAA